MDWQKIIELLISNFSWPITILVLVLILKDKLGRIANLKAKDYEISFENEMNSIKKDVKNDSRFVQKSTTNNINWKVTSTQALRDNMLELSEKSPVAVVLQAWGIMEQTVVECAQKKGFINYYNPSAAIQYLYDNEFIYGGYLDLFFRLYALKEKFTNFENEKVTKERALETSDVILKIAGEIREYIFNINDNEKVKDEQK